MDRYQKPRYKHDYDKVHGLKYLLYRYKKAIIIGGAAMALFLTAATIGIGYFAYKAVTVSAEQVAAVSKKGTQLLENKNLENIAPPEIGVIGGVMADVAKGWLMQSIQNSEVAQIKVGLSCLDALGAPHPKDMLQLIKNNISGTEWLAKIETLESQLIGSKGPQGAQACTEWLIN
jgi:hypothetical protein